MKARGRIGVEYYEWARLGNDPLDLALSLARHSAPGDLIAVVDRRTKEVHHLYRVVAMPFEGNGVRKLSRSRWPKTIAKQVAALLAPSTEGGAS